ncbi:MAG: tRNA pseudouridine(38-40) synthase TruA [Candidatus Eisenbacteria bacterium]
MTVAYEGTEFHGWQRQPGLRTAQGELERALGETLGEPVITAAAGRTDAGVHARGQVVSFRSHTTLPARALVPLLGRRLPPDLVAITAAETDERFDARRSALARRYCYRLLDRDDVLWRRFAWHPGRPVDAEALEHAVKPLEGEHDFTAFEARGSSPSRAICRMMRAGWRRWEGGLALDLTADHFLYHMVRNIVGTALAVMRGADPAAAMRAVLAGRRRAAAGATAPPQGLCLEEVTYPS